MLPKRIMSFNRQVLLRCLKGNHHSDRTMATIGFIGLGNMGGPMALNLLSKGHKVIGYDVSPNAAKKLSSEGATIVSSPSEVASQTDKIISMLSNSSHVSSCYADKGGVFESVKPGTLIIDSSTIDPQVSQELAALAESKGCSFMDAPVSGGVNAAKAATLTFMVGGNKSEFEAAKTILELMGKSIIYCGKVGSGLAAKICNNMLLAITMIGTSETMNLGIRLGLDATLLAGIINTSSGRNWSCDTYNPVPHVMEKVPASNNYQGGFGSALMTKDLGLAQAMATNTHSPTPLGSAAHQIYRIMCNAGYEDKDFSSVFKFLTDHQK